MIVEVQSVGEDSTAFALAEFADAALMAVETALTTRPGAADCLQRLDRLRTSVLGAVVLPAPAGKPARPLPEVSSQPPGRSPARAPSPGPSARPEPRADLAAKARHPRPASKAQGSAPSGSQLRPARSPPRPPSRTRPPGTRQPMPGSRSPGSRRSRAPRSSGSQQSDSLAGVPVRAGATNARGGPRR